MINPFDYYDKISKLSNAEQLEVYKCLYNYYTHDIDIIISENAYKVYKSIVNNYGKRDIIDTKIDFDKLLELINKTFDKSIRKILQPTKNKFNRHICKGDYTKVELMKAIENAKQDEYHIKTNYYYCRPEYFARADIVQKLSQMKIVNKKSDEMQLNNIN